MLNLQFLRILALRSQSSVFKCRHPPSSFISSKYTTLDLSFNASSDVYGSRPSSDLKRTLKRFKSLLFALSHTNLGPRPIEKTLGAAYNEWALLRWADNGHACSTKSHDAIETMVANRKQNLGTMLVCYPSDDDVFDVFSARPRSSNTFLLRETRHTQSEKEMDLTKKAINLMTDHVLGDSEIEYDQNLEVLKKAVDTVADHNPGNGILSIKLSTLGKPFFLLELSEILIKTNAKLKSIEQKTSNCLPKGMLDIQQQSLRNTFLDIDLELCNEDPMKWFWIVDLKKDPSNINWNKLMAFDNTLIDIFQARTTSTGGFGKLLLNVAPLVEMVEIRKLLLRFKDIIEHAQQRSVRLSIDSEQRFIQPAIRRIVLEAMRKYNTSRVLIYSSYQAYLKECLHDIRIDLATAKRNNFRFGVKLVRGDNWGFEKALADKLGSDYPMYTSYEATTAMCESVFQAILASMKQRSDGEVVAILASHNEHSIRYSVNALEAVVGLQPESGVLSFAQWQGLSDYVSVPLANAGYPVYKALPCGSQKSLVRHLQGVFVNNQRSSVVIEKECLLIEEELARRK